VAASLVKLAISLNVSAEPFHGVAPAGGMFNAKT